MNTLISRREFIKYLGIATFFSALPTRVFGATNPRIVVVGGGFAGATCAKYLKLWGGATIDVTVIEENTTYVSPILSNLVLNGQRSTQDLSFTYSSQSAKYGINFIHKKLLSIDSDNQEIRLADNSTLFYDKLVLAPGIDFELIDGLDYSKVPHAWKAGAQTNLLKEQIDSMQDGDRFVMTIPKSPYRCPPGPYERACVVADYLKNTKGFASCEVVVLDANANFTVEAETFGNAFSHYGIDYRTGVTVTSVESDNKSVTYVKNEIATTVDAKALNVIPNQKAAPIIFETGLNSGNWASVNPLSYESTIKNNIYVIGDSQNTKQPKAGHIGNSEAKICADAILRKLNGYELNQAPKTNSACYSPISFTTASWLTAVYEYNPSLQEMQLVPGQNYPLSSGPSTTNFNDMFKWSGNLFSDTFS